MDPDPDPLLLRKSGSAGTLRYVARSHYTAEAVMTSRMHLKNGRSAGNSAYMQKGTTLRAMVAIKPKVSV
jgi:hypothetical protein